MFFLVLFNEMVADEKDGKPYGSNIEGYPGIVAESGGNNHAQKEEHGEVAGPRSKGHFVGEKLLFFRRQGCAEFLLGPKDDEPGEEGAEGAYAGDIHKDLCRHDVVHEHRSKQHRCGEENADPGQAVAVQPLEAGWCISLEGQVVEHTAGAEDTAVAGGQHRRNDDNIDNVCGAGNAQFFKGDNKGAAQVADFIPGINAMMTPREST